MPGTEFDKVRKIWDVALGTIAVAYATDAEREADIKAFRDAAAHDGTDPDSQVPAFDGMFEKDGVPFLVLSPSRTSSRLNNGYAWGGLVVDPSRFMNAVRSGVFSQIVGTRQEVLDVLDHESPLVSA